MSKSTGQAPSGSNSAPNQDKRDSQEGDDDGTGTQLTAPNLDPALRELGLAGGTKRAKKDFADEIPLEVSKATAEADAGRLREGIEILLALEKKARLGGDTHTAGEVALVMCKLCKRAENWTELSATVALIFKRRSQFKSVMQKVVQEAASYVPLVKAKETELELIKTLRHVSEGKLFLEVDRARLTKRLAEIKEKDGDIAGAADVIQEEQVENYGEMDKREKLEYILEQIRLVLRKRDFVRASILSKKVSRKNLEDPTLEDVKIKYYRLVIDLSVGSERDAFEAAQAYLAISTCPGIRADPTGKLYSEIAASALFLALTPHGPDRDSAIRRLLDAESEILTKKLPAFKALLERFITSEISAWPLPEHNEIWKSSSTLLSSASSVSASEDAAFWQKELHDRVIEHNIRVVAGCYTRIPTKRLAEFLCLSVDESESHVSRLVTLPDKGARLFAKIDRPMGIVVFAKRKSPDVRLSELSSDVVRLLDLVERTSHLVNKENVLYGITTETD